MIKIRPATRADYDKIWQIIKEVIARGDTYVFDPATGKEEMLTIWCGKGIHTYVAEWNGNIAGTFMMKDNQPGLGSHDAVHRNGDGENSGAAKRRDPQILLRPGKLHPGSSGRHW